MAPAYNIPVLLSHKSSTKRDNSAHLLCLFSAWLSTMNAAVAGCANNRASGHVCGERASRLASRTRHSTRWHSSSSRSGCRGPWRLAARPPPQACVRQPSTACSSVYLDTRCVWNCRLLCAYHRDASHGVGGGGLGPGVGTPLAGGGSLQPLELRCVRPGLRTTSLLTS